MLLATILDSSSGQETEMFAATTDSDPDKNPDRPPVPPDRRPVHPVKEPPPRPGRDVPEPPVDDPQPDEPRRI